MNMPSSGTTGFLQCTHTVFIGVKYTVSTLPDSPRSSMFFFSQLKREKMGVYASIAVVVSLLFYMLARKKLQRMKDNGGPDVPLTTTNFHQEASDTRPNMGRYYQPVFKIFNN
jgi:hypothetical protein